jgi:CHAT domain-containing protein
VKRDKLAQYVQYYEKEVKNYPSQTFHSNKWQRLRTYLIEPISEHLKSADLIYFIPYGVLHYLPLHALLLNGEPIIKNHPVAYCPSASIIEFCRNKGRDTFEECASFATALEGETRIAKEAENIAKLFSTRPLINPAKKKVLDVLRGLPNDVIHFSCHGHFDFSDPMASGIRLSKNEILTANDIVKLDLNSELITLSACKTGISERRPGDELIGLTRAFLYAGTSSIIVSLWAVDASSTLDLMSELYSLLKTAKKDVSIALQEAQKTIMEKKQYSNVFFWAPFILVGD